MGVADGAAGAGAEAIQPILAKPDHVQPWAGGVLT